MPLISGRTFSSRRRLAVLSILGTAGTLAGCAAQHQVSGIVDGGHEVFSGQALRAPDGAGVLMVTSNRGTQCVGNYVFTEPRQGSGTFRCSDGRTGPFTFVSTGFRGTGTGLLAGRRFTFSFG